MPEAGEVLFKSLSGRSKALCDGQEVRIRGLKGRPVDRQWLFGEGVFELVDRFRQVASGQPRHVDLVIVHGVGDVTQISMYGLSISGCVPAACVGDHEHIRALGMVAWRGLFAQDSVITVECIKVRFGALPCGALGEVGLAFDLFGDDALGGL